MKTLALSIATTIALGISAQAADVSAKITDVHLCCKGCVTGVEKAVGAVTGVKAETDQDGGTVTLTGPDAATVQKAADAMVKAGYYGKSGNATIKIVNKNGATGAKVQTLKVEGVHLCCAKCVKAVDKAVKSVSGVKEQNATKGAKSFEVTGDFKDSDVLEALEKEGLSGKAGK